MGYYDDHYSNSESQSRPQRSQNPRRSGWFLTSLLGALIGILIFTFVAPFLSQYGMLPYTITAKNNAAVNQAGTASPGPTENVNVKVTSAVTKAVDKVSPAVVAVINLQKANFFDNKYTETGIGSGIVYKKQNGYAYIVTNNHVVEGAGKLEVRFNDQDKVTAKLLGRDSLYDLAVLKIKANKVKAVAHFGNSADLKRGEPAIAIGNPLGFSGSVTEGIISAPLRTIPVDTNKDGHPDWQAEVIQTDAAINPGNSGGALVNIQGQVVGINSMKIAQQTVEGIGFAIPINVAKPVINQLEKNGKIERPYLGVDIVPLDMIPNSEMQHLQVPNNVKTGLVVTRVMSNTPAEKAGLKAGDVIAKINGKTIKDYMDFKHYLVTQLKVGQTVTITYYRFGKENTTKLTLGGRVFS